MHTPHPDSHKHGLADDCPECQSHAKRPPELDAENLRRIWGGTIITKTDMDAFNLLYRSVVIVQKLGEAYAWEGFDEFMPGAEFGERITKFEPGPKPDAFALFDHGGRA